MADNKNERDGRDRSRVAADEEYEVQYIANKIGVTASEVRYAIGQVGNNREDIENFLSRKKPGEKN